MIKFEFEINKNAEKWSSSQEFLTRFESKTSANASPRPAQAFIASELLLKEQHCDFAKTNFSKSNDLKPIYENTDFHQASRCFTPNRRLGRLRSVFKDDIFFRKQQTKSASIKWVADCQGPGLPPAHPECHALNPASHNEDFATQYHVPPFEQLFPKKKHQSEFILSKPIHDWKEHGQTFATDPQSDFEESQGDAHTEEHYQWYIAVRQREIPHLRP